MKSSYIYYEQLDQLQASFDALTLTKIAYDSGCDLKTNPINFDVRMFGHQSIIFWDIVDRIFGECIQVYEGLDEYGYEISTFRIHLPELKDLLRLAHYDEYEKIHLQFSSMLSHQDDYFEGEMTGYVNGDKIIFSLTTSYLLFSPVLKKLVDLRSFVHEEIRKRKEEILNNLLKIAMTKLIYQHTGDIVSFNKSDTVNVVYAKILQSLNDHNEIVPEGQLSYHSMITTIKKALLKKVIQKQTEEDHVA